MKIKDVCNLLLIASGVLVSCSAVGQQDLQNALFRAVWDANEGMVDKLLEKGADLSVRDHLGYTPFTVAVARGHEGVVKTLLEKGADPNVRDRGGNPLLALAIERGHEGVADKLLEKGADPNVSGSLGFTPFTLAVENGHEGMVNKLLEKGADLNVRDKMERTPLVIAAMMAATDTKNDSNGSMVETRLRGEKMVRLLGKKGVPFPTGQQLQELPEKVQEAILRNYPGAKEQIQEMMGSWLEDEHGLPRDVARIITDEKLPPDIYSVGGTDYPSGSAARNVD